MLWINSFLLYWVWSVNRPEFRSQKQRTLAQCFLVQHASGLITKTVINSWSLHTVLETFFHLLWLLKFVYSEKATLFCEISTLLLSGSTVDKIKVDILQNCVASSEYTTLTISISIVIYFVFFEICSPFFMHQSMHVFCDLYTWTCTILSCQVDVFKHAVCLWNDNT